MSIEVVNIRQVSKDIRLQVTTVYVGRKMNDIGGSVLGNPFRLDNESEREHVKEKYRHWLWNQMQVDGDVWRELNRLVDLYKEYGELKLMCWCAPKACHADVIKDAIGWIFTTRITQRYREQ